MNATVTFTCTAGTLSIASCPTPQTVATDGFGQIVSGTVYDTAGNNATASVTINVDRTQPILTVTSPADGDSFSTSTATVTSTLSDSLSGASGVTCNGVTATLSGSVYSCNISLTVGVDLVVIRATDVAGNVAASILHVSETGSLPAATSLQVTPTGVNMVVGGAQQFTVVDDQGRPRSDATWSVDNTSIATIDTDSSPTLTAVATGTATLTATVGSVTAQTQITVLAGTALPPGTILWSAPPPGSGSSLGQILQSEPALGMPDLYSVEHNTGASTSLIRAFTADGKQMWNTQFSASALAVPDANGGMLLDFHQAGNNWQLIDLDGKTGAQAWQYNTQYPNFVGFSSRGRAVGGNGRIYLTDYYTLTQWNNGAVGGASRLIALDGATGAILSEYSAPVTSISTTCNDNQTTYTTRYPSRMSNPVVGPDGTAYAIASVDVTQIINNDPSGCSTNYNQTTDVRTLSVLTMSVDGSTALAPFKVVTSDGNSGNTPFVQEVIPDGQGGALVSWWIPGGTTANPSPSYHVTDVSSGGTNDFTLPLLYGPATQMVLGDKNQIAYACDGFMIVAFHVADGSPIWTYTTPNSDLTYIIAETAGGGLSIVDRDSSLNETLLSLDNTGTPILPATTVTGFPLPSPLALGNWAGNRDGSFAEFAGPMLSLTSSDWPYAGGDAEQQNASKFDFELVWCAKGNCSSFQSGTDSNQDVVYSVIGADPPHNATNLTVTQIKTMQTNALNALRTAFAPYKVDVGVGRLASNTAYVSGLTFPACGATNNTNTTWSAIFYPRNQQEAQFAAGMTNGTVTEILVEELGEGIGNGAAHEIGHQLVTRYLISGKIVNGMKMDDSSPNTYNGEACSGSTGAWEFTGGDSGIPIHWSDDAKRSLTNVLGNRN